jgi:hypothetical protein
MTNRPDPEKLYLFICETVKSAGMSFPADMTKINVALRNSGLNYAELGFERCKDMFEYLDDRFELSHPYPSALFVGLRGHAPEPSESVEPDALQRYFAVPLILKQRYIRELHGAVYMKDKDMTAVVLNKLTQRDEITADGWSALIAFAYHNAAESGALQYSKDDKYLRFALGMKSMRGDEIYVLAVKSGRIVREGCQWTLKGVVTRNSQVYGAIIRSMFDWND